MNTKVVNCRRADFDVYIGRGPSPKTGKSGKWGNPFKVSDEVSRAQALRKHAEWILDQPDLIASLHELKGKTLGCWCIPKLCHGTTLARLADMSEEQDGVSVLPDMSSQTWKEELLEKLFDPLAWIDCSNETSIFK